MDYVLLSGKCSATLMSNIDNAGQLSNSCIGRINNCRLLINENKDSVSKQEVKLHLLYI